MVKKSKAPAAIKAALEKAGLVSEVAEDGSVFYYEDENHRTKIKDKIQAKLDAQAAKQAALKAKKKGK